MMLKKMLSAVITLSLGAFVIASGTMVFSSPVAAGGDVASIVRGGLLYDKWFKVIGEKGPSATHALWPASNTKKKGDTTWRCKSCHGWDLSGKDGAYASGSYKTGITGVRGYAGKSVSEVIAVLKSDTHGYSGLMAEKDFADLGLFITEGQVDMSKYIGSDKSVKGDAVKGKEYYTTLCMNCHAADGKQPKDLPKPMGKIASSNPWETLHKIMNGQPRENMPALRALPLQVSLDVLAYTITMPQE